MLPVEHHVCLMLQYGEIEEMNVCDNLGDHLVGNVYIKVSTLFSRHHMLSFPMFRGKLCAFLQARAVVDT